MKDLSVKTTELFPGVAALNKEFASAFSLNAKYKENMDALSQSLNAMITPEILEMSARLKENVRHYESFVVSDFAKRLSEMINMVNLELPEMSNLSRLYIEGFAQRYNIIHVHSEDITEEEKTEEEEVSQRLLNEIFLPDTEKQIVTESPIITVAPINDEVLRYLRDNPEEWYKLSSSKFEMVMQEIYTKLGYTVERTKATRDGGKDLIIRKPEVLGDFIYYVECKKYAPNRPIGLSIVQRLKCVMDTDKVNAGIIATTSFFTRDAKNFILDNKYDCQVKLHDYDTINGFLKKVCI